jgi:hypothetical protein
MNAVSTSGLDSSKSLDLIQQQLDQMLHALVNMMNINKITLAINHLDSSSLLGTWWSPRTLSVVCWLIIYPSPKLFSLNCEGNWIFSAPPPHFFEFKVFPNFQSLMDNLVSVGFFVIGTREIWWWMGLILVGIEWGWFWHWSSNWVGYLGSHDFGQLVYPMAQLRSGLWLQWVVASSLTVGLVIRDGI